MAKVITPNETFENYKTIGSSLTLKQKANAFYVSKRAFKQSRGLDSQSFVEENSQAIREEWEGLTPSEKSSWDSIGAEVFQTGFNTFYNQQFKGMTNSVCGVAICGINRCVLGV